MTTSYLRSVLAGVGLFSCCLTLSAQSDVADATIRGKVLDPNGAAVGNAIILATNASKGTTPERKALLMVLIAFHFFSRVNTN